MSGSADSTVLTPAGSPVITTLPRNVGQVNGSPNLSAAARRLPKGSRRYRLVARRVLRGPGGRRVTVGALYVPSRGRRRVAARRAGDQRRQGQRGNAERPLESWRRHGGDEPV